MEIPIVEQKKNEVNRPVAPIGTTEKRRNEENALEQRKERRIPVIVTEMNTAEVVREHKKSNIEPDMRKNGKIGRTTMLVKEEEKHEVLRILTETNAKAHSYPTSEERTFSRMLMNDPGDL